MRVLFKWAVLPVFFTADGHYQRCTAMADCELLKRNAYIKVKCCQNDLCNTLWSNWPLTFHTVNILSCWECFRSLWIKVILLPGKENKNIHEIHTLYSLFVFIICNRKMSFRTLPESFICYWNCWKNGTTQLPFPTKTVIKYTHHSLHTAGYLQISGGESLLLMVNICWGFWTSIQIPVLKTSSKIFTFHKCTIFFWEDSSPQFVQFPIPSLTSCPWLHNSNQPGKVKANMSFFQDSWSQPQQLFKIAGLAGHRAA